MTTPIRCPRCQTPLPPGTAPDACPRCLLEVALGEAEAPAGPPAPPTPEALNEQFPELEILELVGQGGMGIVYRARQVKLDRVVALKILPTAVADSPGFAARFAREARTMARLDHPHIVRIHEFGEKEGLYYLLMEFVDGSNLRPIIEGGGLAPAEALAIVPQICEALQYAHERGVVHRDIKPENILLARDGKVKVTDFGLAKLVDTVPGEMTLTNAGQVMGTVHYMAPEQYRTPKDVDHRADIYSLGVVFYEMLTGEVPMGNFQAPSERVAVDVRLDDVVLRSLEKERERRYQHASEVRQEVTGIVESWGVACPPAETPPQVGGERVRAARKPPLCRTAVWGFVLSLTSILVFPLLLLFLTMPVEPGGGGPGATRIVAMFLPPAMVLTGLVLSIVGWVRIGRSDGRLRGLGYAITGTLLPIPVILAMLATVLLFASGGRADEPEIAGQEGELDPPGDWVSVAPEPAPPQPAPLAPALPEVQAVWHALLTAVDSKTTPRDLFDAALHPLDARRLERARPEDVARLVRHGLLWGTARNLDFDDFLRAFAPRTVSVDPGLLSATAHLQDADGHGSELLFIADGGHWKMALAPTIDERGAPGGSETVLRGGGPQVTLLQRGAVQAQAALLWSNLMALRERNNSSDFALERLDGLALRRGPGDPPAWWTHMAGLLFTAFLGRGEVTPALRLIDLADDGLTATATFAHGDLELEVPMARHEGRWWFAWSE